MFRPLTDHHQAVHIKKRVRAVQYNVQPSLFSLYVQHDDGLLEAETCSWLEVTIIRSIYKLTLRRLMSYIYMEHPFLMFLDHTQRRSTVGRTPLDD